MTQWFDWMLPEVTVPQSTSQRKQSQPLVAPGRPSLQPQITTNGTSPTQATRPEPETNTRTKADAPPTPRSELNESKLAGVDSPCTDFRAITRLLTYL